MLQIGQSRGLERQTTNPGRGSGEREGANSEIETQVLP